MAEIRKLAESVRRWREQSGECGWTDDRVAACVAAHLQPTPLSDEFITQVALRFMTGEGDSYEERLAILHTLAAPKPAPTEGPNDVIENWWKRWCAADENQGVQTVSGPMTTIENALEFAQWYAGHQLAARLSEPIGEPNEMDNWLTHQVHRGEGVVQLGLTENGDVGVWLPGTAYEANCDGVGDSALEAIEDAQRKSATSATSSTSAAAKENDGVQKS